MNHFKCRHCASNERRHHAHGLCTRCYSRYINRKNGKVSFMVYREYKLMLEPLARAWLAGVIDAKACLYIYAQRVKAGELKKQTCYIAVTCSEKGFLLKIKKLIGCGSVYRSGTYKGKKSWSLRVCSRLHVREILGATLPYMIRQRKKAESVLKWIEANPYRGGETWPEVAACPSKQ
jgi:hypothetical protein